MICYEMICLDGYERCKRTHKWHSWYLFLQGANLNSYVFQFRHLIYTQNYFALKLFRPENYWPRTKILLFSYLYSLALTRSHCGSNLHKTATLAFRHLLLPPLSQPMLCISVDTAVTARACTTLCQWTLMKPKWTKFREPCTIRLALQSYRGFGT